MMKEYQKPALYAERFDLVEHIAKICTVGGGTLTTMKDSVDGCGFRVFGPGDDTLVLFSAIPGCNETDVGDDPWPLYNGESYLPSDMFAS